MPLVTSQGYQLTPDILGSFARGGQAVSQFRTQQLQEQILQQKLAQQQLAQQQQQQQLGNQAQIRQLLGSAGQQAPQTQQQAQLAAQTADFNPLASDALSQQVAAERPQILSFEELKRKAKSIDPVYADKLLTSMGFDDATKRADASRWAANTERLPLEQQNQRIVERAQDLRAQGRDPKDTLELLDMPAPLRTQAYQAVQMLDLSTKERFAVQDRAAKAAKTGAAGGKIGTFNPRDYTVESFAKFAESGNPADLQRFTEKTLDVGGVPHKLNPVTNRYEPIRTTKQVAESKSIIESAVVQARIEATDRGETLTELNQARAALPGLNDAVSKLKELAPLATSTLGGRIFDTAVKESGFGGTKGATARAKFVSIINNQVLPLLKPTFGGSFSVQEGESLKATMGDPDSTPEEKLAQLDAFIAQKVRDIETKERKIDPTADKQTDQVTVIKFDAQGNQI